jgi:DNA-binding response OmpR family regulator
MNTKVKILTVDDDEDIRESVSLLLESEGFETIRAKNGRVAMDYLNSIPDSKLPDLILLDYMMPVMSGDAFCKEKSLFTRLSHIPVVIMTAGGNLVTIMDKVETEASGYISKPMDIKTILQMIEHFIQRDKLNLGDELTS